MAEGDDWTPGEQKRTLQRIEKKVDDIPKAFVSVELYAADKKAGADREATLIERVAKVESNAEKSEEKAATAERATEDQKNRNRLFVYGIFAGPVVGAIVGFMLSGAMTR
jgi:hypothetical protein